jgi:excisionase family DNA binding protein
MNEEIFYDIRAFAQRLHCCTNTAYKLARENRVRHFKIGNRYRFLKSTVDSFLKGSSSVATSGPDSPAP